MTKQIPSNNHLTRLAHRLSNDIEFMAGVLTIYSVQEQLSEQELANLLEISTEKLSTLALCKSPQSSKPDFANQVKQIASYVGVDTIRLANLIRQVEAIEVIKNLPGKVTCQETVNNQSTKEFGWLSAARDRIQSQEDPHITSDKQKNKDEHD